MERWDKFNLFDVIRGVLPPDFIERVLEQKGWKWNSKLDWQGKPFRDTDIYAIDPTNLDPAYAQMIYDWNKANYNFELDENPLTYAQLCRYTKGHFFDMHQDLGAGEVSRRKISVVTMFSDPSDYEGGQLEFPNFEVPLQRGDTVVFPSYVPHSVKPITAGQRWTLVSWFCGPPFR